MEKDKQRRIRVYIAGPMTNGGKGYDLLSIYNAIDVYCELIHHGYVPFCPQLSMGCEMIFPSRLSYEDWLAYDEAIIDDCDVILRMPGVSAGASRECKYAQKNGIPVTYGLDEFLDAWPNNTGS